MRILKTGLKGPKVDRLGRTLKLKEFLKPTFAFPAACDLTTGLVPDVDDLGNVSVGLCALAGPGHFTRWEDQFCKRPTRVFTAQVIDEYQHFGYVPGDETTDNGCYALDVFNRWRKVGLFGTKIEAFAQVAWTNPDEMSRATFLLGGVFLCFNLPNKVKEGSIFEAQTWDVATDDGQSAGGHLVWSDGTNLLNSWGRRILATNAFLDRYAYDAFTVVSRDALTLTGRAFSGLDLAGMSEALRSVTA